MSYKHKNPPENSSSQSISGATNKNKDKTMQADELNQTTANCSVEDISINKSEYSNHDVKRLIAFGKFLMTMLHKRLSDEKIKREKHEMDPMDLLAMHFDRCLKSINQLNEIDNRLEDMPLNDEQKRSLDFKSNECTRIFELTHNFDVEEMLNGLATIEQTLLDRCDSSNVNFNSINKETAYTKILNAVKSALSALECIKEHVFLQEYAKTGGHLHNLKDDRLNNRNIQELCVKVLIEASEILGLDI